MQASQHRNAPEDGLNCRADDRYERQDREYPTRLNSLGPPAVPINERRHDRGDRGDREDEGQQPVAEFDVLVPGLRLAVGGDVGALHTLGPRGATKPTAGDPDDGAGQDDPGLHDQIRDVHAPNPPGGQPGVAPVLLGSLGSFDRGCHEGSVTAKVPLGDPPVARVMNYDTMLL